MKSGSRSATLEEKENKKDVLCHQDEEEREKGERGREERERRERGKREEGWPRILLNYGKKLINLGDLGRAAPGKEDCSTER